MKNQKSKQFLSSPTISLNSRVDRYWRENGFDNYLGFIRPKLEMPKSLEYASNPSLLTSEFGIVDIGFGNWVTNEDRFNYINSIHALQMSLSKFENCKLRKNNE
jgi:hypothetical protein